MTYCVAWKKFDKAFMIADSAISSFKSDINSEYSSFGERQGLYNQYFVYESALKIIKINESIAVCYSGDKKEAEEAIESIKVSIKFFSLIEVLENLKSTYGYGKKSFELLIICYEDKNKIYHFKGDVYYEVERFIDIGSGRDIQELSDSLKNFIYNNEELMDECEPHLAGVISYIQSISMKNNFYDFGVGGAFFGLYVDRKINWCKDLHYYIYNNDVYDVKTVSIISRYDGVYSASGFDSSIKYFYNQGSNQEILSDLYFQEGIRKSLNTSIPDYFIFYSPIYNVIYILNIKKWSHNTRFRMWIMRQEENTKFTFAFDPLFRTMLISDESSKKLCLDFYNVLFSEKDFIPREEFVNKYLETKNVPDLKDEFDYDLRHYKVDFSYNNFKIIHDTVLKFRNIIIVDYEFICNIISEKFELYKESGLTMEMLDFAKLVEKFLPNIASSNFNDYGVYIVKDSNVNRSINDFSMDEWFNSYPNFHFIIDMDNNYRKELSGIVFEAIKNYYFEELFFHIDKIIIACDDADINEILSIAPKINFEKSSPDIILIRNFNGLSVMDGRFRYIVIDYEVGHMFGLNIDKIGQLESGFKIDIT